MKLQIIVSLLVFSSFAGADIPDWYKRDIKVHIDKAHAVVLYKVVQVSEVSVKKPYHSYRIDTQTIQVLKGSAPAGECYLISTEGKWKSPKKSGDKAIVILNYQSQGECGIIEPGFTAPATPEYIDFFHSIIAVSPNNQKAKNNSW